MKKRVMSFLLAVMLVISMVPVTSLAETNQVHVVVENQSAFTTSLGAEWDGILVDTWVPIDSTSTMMSCIQTALEGHEVEGAESGYISAIDGLEQMDGGSMSGWMGTKNDWMTNEGFDEFTVANGKLVAGDEIRVMYSLDYGADIGGDFTVTDTSLKGINISEGSLSQTFTSEQHEYNLILPTTVSAVNVTPTASNKCFLVKTFVNNTEYKRNESIPVEDGTVITVKCGDPTWPSMVESPGATTYTFIVHKQDLGSVRVIVENKNAITGANWTGVLVDKLVTLQPDSTLMSCLTDALGNMSSTGTENAYVTEINGLSAGDAGSMSGWVYTLNDWFTDQGASAYTVAAGTLEKNDVIRFQYSLNYGADCGMDWVSTNTSIESMAFSAGKLDKTFDSSNGTYTLILPSSVKSVTLDATAVNKVFQIRSIVGEKEYKRTEPIPVEDGTVIKVKCGDPAWPSYPISESATSYTFTVKKAAGCDIVNNTIVAGGNSVVTVTNGTIDGYTILEGYQIVSAEMDVNGG